MALLWWQGCDPADDIPLLAYSDEEVHVVKAWWNTFCVRLSRFRSVPAPGELADSLAGWYATPYGRRLLARQRMAAASALERMGGYRAMLMSVTTGTDLLAGGRMLHRFAISNLSGDPANGAIADYDALPLPSNLIDAVVLHHVLDYCELPHESLKEVARVVAPSGYLVVFGFNPWSWMGLSKWPMRLFSEERRWQSRSLSSQRVMDWLRLLGFQVEYRCFGGFSPPLQSGRVQSLLGAAGKRVSLGRLPLGAFYMIVARKQVLRPLESRQPAWLARAIKPLQVPEGARIQQVEKKTD